MGSLGRLDVDMDAYLLVRAIEEWLAHGDPVYVAIRAELDRWNVSGTDLEYPNHIDDCAVATF